MLPGHPIRRLGSPGSRSRRSNETLQRTGGKIEDAQERSWGPKTETVWARQNDRTTRARTRGFSTRERAQAIERPPNSSGPVFRTDREAPQGERRRRRYPRSGLGNAGPTSASGSECEGLPLLGLVAGVNPSVARRKMTDCSTVRSRVVPVHSMSGRGVRRVDRRRCR